MPLRPWSRALHLLLNSLLHLLLLLLELVHYLPYFLLGFKILPDTSVDTSKLTNVQLAIGGAEVCLANETLLVAQHGHLGEHVCDSLHLQLGSLQLWMIRSAHLGCTEHGS